MNQEFFAEASANANAAFSNENYEAALEWYEKALGENPDDVEVLSRAGTACVVLEKYDDAFRHFEKAKQLAPDNGDCTFNLGNAYFFHGDYGQALSLYAQAEMMDCSDDVKQRLYYQMAMLCSAKGDVQSALVNLKKYESSDPSGLVALDPDVISEKIKLYMMAQDIDNAEKHAVQWITIAPAQLNGYMVYFSLLMLKRDFERAEKALDDAAKFVDLTDEMKLEVETNRASLYVEIGGSGAENAAEYLQKAYDLLTELRPKVDPTKQDEFTLTLADVCVKMERYDEAIGLIEALVSDKGSAAENVAEHDPDGDPVQELVDRLEQESVSIDEQDLQSMLSQDMGDIDTRMAAGDLSDDEYAEIAYDELGKEVRMYSGAILDHDADAASADGGQMGPVVSTSGSSDEFRERANFLLLACYAQKEDYQKVYDLATKIKESKNMYYAFYGRYTEAFAMKKLADAGSGFTKEDAENKYNEALAFFRSAMIKTPENTFAVVFRARMYAESGKFAKAEEMASLLSPDEKSTVSQYIELCRSELKNEG